MTPHLTKAADALDVSAATIAAELATATGQAFDSAFGELAAEFRRRSKVRTTQELDGRASRWRVRVRLYRAERLDDAIADSDPDLSADTLPATTQHGLPGVAAYLTALASAFHGQPCAGLDRATLQHKLKSLRPTLSRRGGDAVWRVPYSVMEHPVGAEVEQSAAWLARVDVARAVEVAG